MSLKHQLFVVLLITVFLPLSSQAASFGNFDPRSLGMGGTGVASANSGNASYYNPALLSVGRDDDDFSLEAPIFGIRAADPNGLQDTLDAFQAAQYETALSNAITAFIASTTTADAKTNAAATATAAQNLITGFNSLSNKGLVFEANLGAVIGIPNRSIGIAIMTNHRAIGGAELNIAASDTADLSTFISELEYFAINGTSPGGAVYLSGSGAAVTSPDLSTGLASTVNVRGAIIQETGLSLATDFNIFGFPVAIGITPKNVSVTTFDYAVGVQSASIDSKQGKKEYSDSNFDIGIASYLGGGLRVGAVAKNVSEKSYLTVLNNVVDVKTQLRAGIAHQTYWTTLAVDVDLTSNEPAGFDESTQYIAAGFEFNLFNLMQVRVGKRHNRLATTTTEGDITTFGLGFSPLGIHIDLAYAGSSKDKALAMQLGFRF